MVGKLEHDGSFFFPTSIGISFMAQNRSTLFIV